MRILTIDIGGTFIKYAVMDENGAIGERGKVPTPRESREEFLTTLEGIFRETGSPEGVAVSMPGTIDYETGTIMNGGAIPYNYGFPMRDALSGRLGVPVSIENDGKCAAMAEASFGALKDVRDGCVLVFGTNIGGGIVIDHKVRRGPNGTAGEVTYITPIAEQPAVENLWGETCGVPGLLYLYALEYRKIRTEEGTFREEDLIRKENVKSTENGVFFTTKDVRDGAAFFAALGEGDPAAEAAFDRYTGMIAAQIFNLQTILDAGRFAIGGGISEQPVFIERVREKLAGLYKTCPRILSKAEVVPCTFHNDANLIGALGIFLAEQKEV